MSHYRGHHGSEHRSSRRIPYFADRHAEWTFKIRQEIERQTPFGRDIIDGVHARPDQLQLTRRDGTLETNESSFTPGLTLGRNESALDLSDDEDDDDEVHRTISFSDMPTQEGYSTPARRGKGNPGKGAGTGEREMQEGTPVGSKPSTVHAQRGKGGRCWSSRSNPS